MKEIEKRMDKTIEILENRLSTVRAGRANAEMLKGIKVFCYQTETPIESICTISVPQAREIHLRPYDKNTLKDIEKAIFDADRGYTPTNTGEEIIITIPELTEETRRNSVKQVKEMGEEAKISLRNIRQDEVSKIKKEQISEDIKRDKENEVQEIINKYNKRKRKRTYDNIV